jgi:hypothetical protein
VKARATSAAELHFEAALACADVDSEPAGDATFRAAKARLTRAAQALCLAQGWRPPPDWEAEPWDKHTASKPWV